VAFATYMIGFVMSVWNMYQCWTKTFSICYRMR